MVQLPRVAALLLVVTLSLGAEPAQARSGPPFAFFAFDNGVGRNRWTPEQQAATLARLGYDGIGYSGLEQLAERLTAFEKHGLRVYNLYVGARVGPDGPTYDSLLKESLTQLRGRNVALWLYVNGNTDDGDAQAIRVVSEIADLAAAHWVRVVLYPRTGFHIATVADVLRVAKASGRFNIGVTFNLCHNLKMAGEQGWRDALVAALPLLEFVSVKGADAGVTSTMGWNRLIQPLGIGSFDVAGVPTALKALGYRGPVRLQCYNVPGDHEENLTRMMQALRSLTRTPARLVPSC